MLDNSHLSPSVPTHRSKNIQDESGTYTGVICHRIRMAAVSPSPPLPSRRPFLCSPRCTSEASGVKPGSLRSHSHEWTGSHPHRRNTAFLLDGQKKISGGWFQPCSSDTLFNNEQKSPLTFYCSPAQNQKIWYWPILMVGGHLWWSDGSRWCTPRDTNWKQRNNLSLYFLYVLLLQHWKCPRWGSIKVYLICVSKRPFRGKLSIAQAKCVTATVHLLCSKLLRACVLSVAATCLNEATMKV